MTVHDRRHHHSIADSGIESPHSVAVAEKDLLAAVRVDHRHDVPLIAGMSVSGKVCYVDRIAYPMIMKLGYLAPLMIHEIVEHLLMTIYRLEYDPAHAIATGAEEAAAVARGINLPRYNRNFDKIILAVTSRPSFPMIPIDLDRKPYRESPRADLPTHVPSGLLYGGG